MEKVSKNFYKGDVVKSISELNQLSLEKKSVYTKFWKLKPAAVLMSMQCRMINRLIEQKQIFKIIKIEKDGI